MNREKVKIGIIGTGNIGTDLLMKVMSSKVLECGIFVGRNLNSEGMIKAKQLNVPITDKSIDYIIENPDCCSIVFDATSASTHLKNAPILKKLGKFTIDLTPSKYGTFCIPVINIDNVLDYDNVNMVTCGGQATIPIAKIISKNNPDTKYIEVVSTIASKSAGIGTRDNIDEFTQTTKEALTYFTGIKNTKAIITLNPAEPPITMHSTVYALIENPKIEQITKDLKILESKMKKYVPGFEILNEPIYENGRLTIPLKVTGSGDFLPKYAGNLDIITCAAIEIAEKYVIKKLGGNYYE